MHERKSPVVFGRNNDLSMSIGESVLLIDDRANEAVRELISPIVGNRNALYDNAPSSVDVHPRPSLVIVIEYHRQAVSIEFKSLDIILCDEHLSLTILQNTVRMTINVVSCSKDAAITGPCHIDCYTLSIDSL